MLIIKINHVNINSMLSICMHMYSQATSVETYNTHSFIAQTCEHKPCMHASEHTPGMEVTRLCLCVNICPASKYIRVFASDCCGLKTQLYLKCRLWPHLISVAFVQCRLALLVFAFSRTTWCRHHAALCHTRS